eukprot:jgi/Botrbrau1/11665/Bobra.168_2s0020.1
MRASSAPHPVSASRITMKSTFVPPWQYDGNREEAAEQLIDIITGGRYKQGLTQDPYGDQSSGCRKVHFGICRQRLARTPTTRQAAAGGWQRRRGLPFKAAWSNASRTKPAACTCMLYLIPGAAGVVDAEFLFPPGDNIVGVRAASRKQPGGFRPASLKLSMSSGLVLDANATRQEMDRLRKALSWEVTICHPKAQAASGFILPLALLVLAPGIVPCSAVIVLHY